MKSLIILTLFAFVVLVQCNQAYRETTVAERIEIHKNCVAEGKIDQDLQNQYAKMNYPNDSKTRCYVKCYLEATGMFKANSFHLPAWKEYLQDKITDPNVLNEGLTECTKPKSSNPCDIAYFGYKCLAEKGFTKYNPTFI